jgi:UDP-3-O-[3-hydroxymyristoyl] glucosamine N-acyltransferase
MTDKIAFFAQPTPISIRQIIELTGVEVADNTDIDQIFTDIAPLDRAKQTDISFFDNAAYAGQAKATNAGICFVGKRLADRIPSTTISLISPEPYRAFAMLAGHMYPASLVPLSIDSPKESISKNASIDPSVKLEHGVAIDSGVVIGANAEIGRNTVIAANAVIGANVKIGRDSYIGPNASIIHTLIGNRVIIHGGARVGQDGFGFAMGPKGHLKVPQIGRVVIQDNVEIGANTCIDRGANRDTVIGEGTKIDNLVQIGHNVEIGRHCVIVSQVGISGSTILEDYVVIGGQVGVVGHVRIGMASQIAASSNVNSDVPAGSRWGGTPAKPVREWFREISTLKNLAKKGKASDIANNDNTD